jgi:F5/8 type C domain-containing protein
MIILSQAVVLNPQDVQLNTPVFGWRNLATAITATSEAEGYPASNLTNPSTALRWMADETSSPGPDSTDQYLTVDTSTFDDIDYVAIAVHNLGTGQNTLSVEHLDTDVSPEAWTELVEEHILANDDPVLFRFTPATYQSIRLRIQPSPLAEQTIPFVAVMHVGKLLVMPRGTHQDHAPINLNITSNVMTGKSETGNFLGRVVLNESRSTSIAFQRLNAAWYRTYVQPFIIASKADAFFFAWKPQEFTRDVGYCWMTQDPQPSRHFETGTMALSLSMGGVAVS